MRTDDGTARFRGRIEQQSDERIERKRGEKIDRRAGGDEGHRQRKRRSDEGEHEMRGTRAARTKKREREEKRERERTRDGKNGKERQEEIRTWWMEEAADAKEPP